MKNYIEMFMRDNDLKLGEKFRANDKIVYFDDFYSLRTYDGKLEGVVFMGILQGNYEIEKIKPKTLMEQLKEQGFGYLIQVQGAITNVTNSDFVDGVYDKMIMQCNVFLTKSEAEREIYRRELEFEMQEWAREHDCLCGAGHMSIQPYNGFNVCVKNFGFNERLKGVFNEKVDKYYNWNE